MAFDLDVLVGMVAFPWVAQVVVADAVMRGVALEEGEHLTLMLEDLTVLMTLILPLVEEEEGPWMMEVLDLEVVVEGEGHLQTTDVVCLLMIMDSWQPIVSLLQIHVFLLLNLF